jgi:hypothetical protein
MEPSGLLIVYIEAKQQSITLPLRVRGLVDVEQ